MNLKIILIKDDGIRYVLVSQSDKERTTVPVIIIAATVTIRSGAPNGIWFSKIRLSSTEQC